VLHTYGPVTYADDFAAPSALARSAGLTPARARAVRHGLWVGALFALIIVATELSGVGFGFDAHAYWTAWRHDHLYGLAPQQADAYLYSPVFAQVIWPLVQLPWWAFAVLWTAAMAGIYLWLLAPVDRRWRVPLLVLCSLDLVAGNVWALLALVLVFGLSYPAAWALPALTKVSPVVGPIWFLARREWRSLVIAATATLAIAAVSFAFAPHLWRDWLQFLAHPPGAAPGTELRAQFHPSAAVFLAFGLPIAIAITVFGARRDRPWLLPVAMVFAVPVFSINALLLLTAIPRIVQRSQLRSQA
jgi:Glycosyltransferase family 87